MVQESTQWLHERGRKLSNWGRWGAEDQLGTLNHITPDCRVEAARLVRRGVVFELSIPLDQNGPQRGGLRVNPVHTMSMLHGEGGLPADVLSVADDVLFMPLQSATQWDSLAHVGYAGRLYNDVPTSVVTAREGASRLAIDNFIATMVARGVVLDIARLRGEEWLLADSEPIRADELQHAAESQGVEIRPGDILLVRTGWRRKYIREGWSQEWITTSPGLHHSCAEWLQEREIAAVASDTWAVEVQPSDVPGIPYPLHSLLLRDMGMILGEMFDLELLAADCAADGQWDVLLSAPPLRIPHAVGSPVSPIAIK